MPSPTDPEGGTEFDLQALSDRGLSWVSGDQIDPNNPFFYVKRKSPLPTHLPHYRSLGDLPPAPDVSTRDPEAEARHAKIAAERNIQRGIVKPHARVLPKDTRIAPILQTDVISDGPRPNTILPLAAATTSPGPAPPASNPEERYSTEESVHSARDVKRSNRPVQRSFLQQRSQPPTRFSPSAAPLPSRGGNDSLAKAISNATISGSAPNPKVALLKASVDAWLKQGNSLQDLTFSCQALVSEVQRMIRGTLEPTPKQWDALARILRVPALAAGAVPQSPATESTVATSTATPRGRAMSAQQDSNEKASPFGEALMQAIDAKYSEFKDSEKRDRAAAKAAGIPVNELWKYTGDQYPTLDLARKLADVLDAPQLYELALEHHQGLPKTEVEPPAAEQSVTPPDEGGTAEPTIEPETAQATEQGSAEVAEAAESEPETAEEDAEEVEPEPTLPATAGDELTEETAEPEAAKQPESLEGDAETTPVAAIVEPEDIATQPTASEPNTPSNLSPQLQLNDIRAHLEDVGQMVYMLEEAIRAEVRRTVDVAVSVAREEERWRYTSELEQVRQSSQLVGREAEMLDVFRKLDADDQDYILQLAQRLARKDAS